MENKKEYDIIESIMRLQRAMRRQPPRPPFGMGHGKGMEPPRFGGRRGRNESADGQGMTPPDGMMPPPPGGMLPPPGGMIPPPEGLMRLTRALSESGSVSSRELAELLDIRPSSLTELLARAEKAGIITRTPDENDKRVVRVSLSDEGKKLVEKAEQHRSEQLERFSSCFTPEERAQFCQLCDKLCAHLEQLNSENGGEDAPDRGFRPPFGGGPCGHGRGFGHGGGCGRGRHMGHMPPPPFGFPFDDASDDPDDGE